MDKNTLDNIVVCAEELGWSRTGESGFCFTKEFEEESDFSDEDSPRIVGHKNRKWRKEGHRFQQESESFFLREFREQKDEMRQEKWKEKRDRLERLQDRREKQQKRKFYD